jgi:hypothetical protein
VAQILPATAEIEALLRVLPMPASPGGKAEESEVELLSPWEETLGHRAEVSERFRARFGTG